MSKLYRAGSVAYVSKSGGMSNELNNIIARNSDGVYEGVAIGGDRYPGSLFLDHLLRYNDNPEVKMMVLLGEVGGIDEYAVAEAIKRGRITKPLVAWVMGTCASIFPYEVQFGHAGATNRQTPFDPSYLSVLSLLSLLPTLFIPSNIPCYPSFPFYLTPPPPPHTHPSSSMNPSLYLHLLIDHPSLSSTNTMTTTMTYYHHLTLLS